MLGNVLLIGSWVGSVIACYFIGKHKERPITGVIIALLMGWLGLIIFAMFPTKQEAAEYAASLSD